MASPSAATAKATEPAPEPVAAAVPAEGEAMPNRTGSFYSRRSAKLPRIGNEAGKSALAAATAMRRSMHGDEQGDAESA